MIHEDERRKLIDMEVSEEWRGCKAVVAKRDCILGMHYHKIKTEAFCLVTGEAVMVTKKLGYTVDHTESMEIGKTYVIKPETVHTFRLRKGSVLNCLVSHPYDKSDDFQA